MLIFGVSVGAGIGAVDGHLLRETGWGALIAFVLFNYVMLFASQRGLE